MIIPQFVELPDGERFFTIARTTDRPTFSKETQDRRLVLSLGCSIEHCDKIVYADPYARKDMQFSEIGINCHLCPVRAIAAAHQPMLVELDPTRAAVAAPAMTVPAGLLSNSPYFTMLNCCD